MFNHKYIRVILAVCFLLAVLGALYGLVFNFNQQNEQSSAAQNMPVETYSPEPDEALYDDDETPLDYDKDAKWREAPIFIDDIDPKSITTTAKLHEVFDRFMLYSIPTVEIVNLPSDFAQDGDAELFIKAVLPLVMRTNEKIAQDRKFLLGLADKMKKNEAWTPAETVRFEQLTRTYDTFNKKTTAGQMAELLDKVDVVPNSLVLAQMGVQTDWGKKNADSPLGQKEWQNGKYDLKRFKTLPEAVQSFMLEINSMPQYQTFRTQRRVFKNLRGSLSARLLDYMSPFDSENPAYLPQLKEAYRTYNLGPLDNALFWQ